MKIVCDILLITIIVVSIVELSGFVNEFKIMLFRRKYGKRKMYKPFSLKPFDCSLCMTWWLGVTYLLIMDVMTIQAIAYVIFMALMAEHIGGLILLIKDAIVALLNILNELIARIDPLQ